MTFSSSRTACPVALLLVFAMCPVLLSVGCSTTTDAATTHEVSAASGESFTVSMADGRAHEVVTTAGQRVRFDDGEAIVGDHLILAGTEGTIQTFRTPRAIMAEVDQLPTPYLTKDTFELVILDGDQGSHATEPTTGRELLRAVTCENPDCPGQPSDEHPFLFNSLGDSRTSRGSVEVEARKRALPALPCPACSRTEHVVLYELANSARRKAALLSELAKTRAARDRSAQ